MSTLYIARHICFCKELISNDRKLFKMTFYQKVRFEICKFSMGLYVYFFCYLIHSIKYDLTDCGPCIKSATLFEFRKTAEEFTKRVDLNDCRNGHLLLYLNDYSDLLLILHHFLEIQVLNVLSIWCFSLIKIVKSGICNILLFSKINFGSFNSVLNILN